MRSKKLIFRGWAGLTFKDSKIKKTNLGYEVIYNELAEYPFSLAKFATENKDMPKEALEFCSCEEFKALKAKENKTPIDFVKLFAYSFRCTGTNYFCSPRKAIIF